MAFISRAISGNADNRHQRDMQMREHEMEKLRMVEERLYREQLERQATADRESNRQLMEQITNRNAETHNANMEAINSLGGGKKTSLSTAASAEQKDYSAAVDSSGSSNDDSKKILANSFVNIDNQNSNKLSMSSKSALLNSATANPH